VKSTLIKIAGALLWLDISRPFGALVLLVDEIGEVRSPGRCPGLTFTRFAGKILSA